MDYLQLIVLSLIQGVTEFLPISSSAHLVLVSRLSGWPDQGLALDVAAHLGSLLALGCYFRRELRQVLLCGPGAVPDSPYNRRLLACLLVASVPTLLVGWLCRDFIASELRSVAVIAWASIGFGLLLWWCDWRGRRVRSLATLGWVDAGLIGLAQVLALIPGTSRAGITMTMALWLGFQRTDAARFSFLLAFPVIGAVSLYEGLRLWQQGGYPGMADFLWVLVCSWLSAWLVIHYFLRFLQHIGLLPFVIYRVLLGLVLLIWL